MKRCGICMEERSPLWVHRSKSTETLCRLLITMVEETFGIRRSWDLLHPCQYVFLFAKPPWQPLDHIHLLHQKFGIHCQTIFRLFQLFLLLEDVSNTIFCWGAYPDSRTPGGIAPSERITLRDTTPPTAIHHLEISCRPAKRVPSERLRLAKVINPHIGYIWAHG